MSTPQLLSSYVANWLAAVSTCGAFRFPNIRRMISKVAQRNVFVLYLKTIQHYAGKKLISPYFPYYDAPLVHNDHVLGLDKLGKQGSARRSRAVLYEGVTVG